MKKKIPIFWAVLVMILIVEVLFTQIVWSDEVNKDIIAIVLGKKLTIDDKDRFNGLIWGSLLDQFAKDNNIEPTDEEIDAFILKTNEKQKQQQIKFEQDRQQLLTELKSNSLSDQERKEKESRLQTIESILKTTSKINKIKNQAKEVEEHQMARHFVRSWKINKALYEKYGGRVIFQQAGPEPLDAYREFLKEEEKNGTFQILDKKYEASFWEYFTNDAMHTFYSKENGAKFINTPWWMMEEPPEE